MCWFHHGAVDTHTLMGRVITASVWHCHQARPYTLSTPHRHTNCQSHKPFLIQLSIQINRHFLAEEANMCRERSLVGDNFYMFIGVCLRVGFINHLLPYLSRDYSGLCFAPSPHSELSVVCLVVHTLCVLHRDMRHYFSVDNHMGVLTLLHSQQIMPQYKEVLH